MNLEQTAGPDTDDDLARGRLGMADQLEPRFAAILGLNAGVVVPANGPHQLRGG